MKVLIVSNVFPPGYLGGYELMAYDVARGMAAGGHSVRVLTSNYFLGDGAEAAGLAVARSLHCTDPSHEWPVRPDALKGSFLNYQNLRVLGGQIRDCKPDVVICFSLRGLGGIAIIQYLQSIGCPLVLFFAGDYLGAAAMAAEWRAYEAHFGSLTLARSTRVVSVSTPLSERIASMIGGDGLAIETVPAWSVADGNGAVARQQQPRRNGRSFRFVLVSGPRSQRDCDQLLRAAGVLLASGLRDFRVDIYGPGNFTDFLRRSKANGLQEHLRVLGSISRESLNERLGEYDALLFPADDIESIGLVVVDAAARGCIPVVSARAAAAEWFLDGIDCIKMAGGLDVLAAAMRTCIEMNDDDLVSMREGAAFVAATYLDFGEQLKRIASLSEAACRAAPRADLDARSRSVEASFLVLSGLLGEREHIPDIAAPAPRPLTSSVKRRKVLLVSCYNYEKYVETALNSALSQTIPFDLIVVVNDGSTDGSLAVVEKLAAKHGVIRIVDKPNGGQLSAFNAAVDFVERDDCVFLLDADDYFPSDYLENVFAVWDCDAVPFFFGELQVFTHDHEVPATSRVDDRPSSVIDSSKYLTATRFVYVGRPTSCQAVTGEVFLSIFPYAKEQDWRICADAVLVFASSLKGYRKIYDPTIRIGYRVHDKNNYHRTARERMVGANKDAEFARACDELCEHYLAGGRSPHYKLTYLLPYYREQSALRPDVRGRLIIASTPKLWTEELMQTVRGWIGRFKR